MITYMQLFQHFQLNFFFPKKFLGQKDGFSKNVSENVSIFGQL